MLSDGILTLNILPCLSFSFSQLLLIVSGIQGRIQTLRIGVEKCQRNYKLSYTKNNVLKIGLNCLIQLLGSGIRGDSGSANFVKSQVNQNWSKSEKIGLNCSKSLEPRNQNLFCKTSGSKMSVIGQFNIFFINHCYVTIST